jgi:serine/threonine-protein kinase HipA
MNPKKLKVTFHHQEVGILALMSSEKVCFQYSLDWLKNGFSISPLSLPLIDKLYVPKDMTFDGLFGVFADSLPDSWGSLLLSRHIQQQGISYRSLNVLDKLSYLGEDALGALRYEPCYPQEKREPVKDYDLLKTGFDKVIENKPTALDELFRLGGSSGGTRPKAHVLINGEEWIVKFPYRYDPPDIGKMEYDYNVSAKACGLDVPEFALFPSQLTSGYFGEKRFDRENGLTKHVITLSGLLEVSPDFPSLDYLSFFRLTDMLTENTEELWKVFRILCFNVFSHNVDDHSKNFSFIYDETKKSYRLSPSYDLTGSTGEKEHEMTLLHQGNPTEKDIRDFLFLSRLDVPTGLREMARIQKQVNSDLGKYLKR